VSAREVLAELDRLTVSIFYRANPDGSPVTPIRVGGGADRVYPELRRALEERTPELLRVASFQASRHTPGTYVRRPGPRRSGGF
jgi:hypothetical protein